MIAKRVQVLVLALGSELFLRVIASHNRALPYSVRLRRRIFLVAAFVSILLELVSSALREIVVSKQVIIYVLVTVCSLTCTLVQFTAGLHGERLRELTRSCDFVVCELSP